MRQLTTALAVVGICILVAGCNGANHRRAKSSSAKQTSTTQSEPMLTKFALPDLLLNPQEINAAMGATAMEVTKTHFQMSDDSASMEPRECLAVDGAVQAQAYQGSGFTDERDQTLQEGDNFTHYAQQAVVLFPSPKHATDFYNASAKQWQACHRYSHIQSGSQWTAGSVTNNNGMLDVLTTQENANTGGWACGRALTARNNVVVDVNTCSANPGDSAIKIASKIADKVTAKPPSGHS